MKILITGGAGFIGSHVADLLLENEYDVCIVDNLSSGKLENVNSNAKFYKCDIRDSQIYKIIEDEKPQIIIHNAAQMSVRNSVEDPLNDADINIIGGLNILEAAKKTKVEKIIFASSGGVVYGEQQYFPADEDHPTKPICPYGVAKLSYEKYLYYYHYIFGIKYIALRYANIYGPRQDPYGEAGVVAIFSKKLLSDDQPVINGDGMQTRDYVYVKDVATANLLAVNTDYIGEINIGTALETNVNKIFNILKNAAGKPDLEEVHGPAKDGEQKRSVLSYRKAQQILGWKPEVKLEEGLVKTFNWFKEENNY
ncbi:MAG: GDP-mannose 4,6-dehydratase [Actinobacteria bacterium]|nr:GDP-mannose 4,6-dehydratase [Cyanobacteriota bacterium]MCL5771826.1 GDP-mannose 4,6-dehydratase [Actinomycetota bacterium]